MCECGCWARVAGRAVGSSGMCMQPLGRAHRSPAAPQTMQCLPPAAPAQSPAPLSTAPSALCSCDAEFKPDLANKICMLVQRYAPDKRWYIDSLLQVGGARGGEGLWAVVDAKRG